MGRKGKEPQRASISLNHALALLGNRHMGAADLTEAVKVVADHRGEIPAAQKPISAEVKLANGKTAEIVVQDPRLFQLRTKRGDIVIFDNRPQD